MKQLVVDIDNTITIHNSHKEYQSKSVNWDVVNKLRQYQEEGFEIVLYTARNMRTFDGDLSKINKITAPTLIEWLNVNNIPYDGIIYGKPWCGNEGFYVDDKAIRPSEFVNLTYEEIRAIIK